MASESYRFDRYRSGHLASGTGLIRRWPPTKGEPDITLNNILGSNILSMVGIVRAIQPFVPGSLGHGNPAGLLCWIHHEILNCFLHFKIKFLLIL
jgi:hypothetical protein